MLLKAGIFIKKPILFRGLFYAAGLLILALGLTLNTKTGLGVSPIISVAYSISVISGHGRRRTDHSRIQSLYI